jgi:hypothetical protein
VARRLIHLLHPTDDAATASADKAIEALLIALLVIEDRRAR